MHETIVANKKQASDEEVQKIQISEFWESEEENKRVNEIFNIAQESALVATDQGF